LLEIPLPYVAKLCVCLVQWIMRDEEGWDGVISFFMFDWETILSVKYECQWIWNNLILKNKNGWDHPSPLTSFVVTYEDVITLVIPPIKHESGWGYPSFSSLKSNMMWNKLIPEIMDGSITFFIDAQPNTPNEFEL
jgi:hypothetical protein